MGYVIKVFDVHLEVGKRLVSGFDLAQVVFSLVLFLSDPGFAVLSNDPGDRVNPPGEIKFILEVFSPKAGEALT